MIKVFRKIRQKLLKDNNMKSYFKYAIGEIVLVVIGILIAVQLNDLNEKRKRYNEETIILKNLYENLSLAKRKSYELIEGEKLLKQKLILVLGLDSTQIDNYSDKVEDDNFIDALWHLENYIPIINVYTDLKYTNKLELIQNKKIKAEFTDLEVKLNDLQSIIDDRLNVQQLRIDDIAENNINIIPLIKTSIPNVNIQNETPNNYSKILKNQRIRNLLGMKLIITQSTLDYRKDLDIEIGKLKMHIAEELENR